jgi:hypothetical protein
MIIDSFSTNNQEQITNLKNFNFDNMLTSINLEINNIRNLIAENNSPWKNFNEQ